MRAGKDSRRPASTASGRSLARTPSGGASEWRCLTGECQPASRWIKADRLHTLIPRDTDRWWKLYRTRAAVEREFGRLKRGWGIATLRVRRLARVRLHADLTDPPRLAVALDNARHTEQTCGRCPSAA